jgi:tRNA-dihydrouridine synthase
MNLRTKKEMSKVPAHFELIPDIVALRDEIAPQTLLTINGDIENRAHGEQLVRDNPGINGIMIGRGIFHDPFAFTYKEFADENERKKALLALLRLQLDLFDQWQPQTGRPFETLKRFFKIYVRDFDGASDLRASLMLTHSTDEVRNLIDE